MKTVSIFLALLNSLFAGLLILLDLSYHGFMQDIWWWSLFKISTASMIILVGICTWLREMRIIPSGIVLWGGLFLFALGPATLVWAVHVALSTGDIEFHMVVYGMSLMVQGVASLLGAGEASHETGAQLGHPQRY